MIRHLARTAALGALLAVVGVAVTARAEPLDAEACAKLKTEHEALEKGGVRTNQAKGPEWGKANLKPEQLEEIRRVIELDEQLVFRCGAKQLVVLPPEIESQPPDEKAKADGEGQAKGTPKGTAPKQAQPRKASNDKAKQPQGEGSRLGGEPAADAAPAAKAKPKAKAKAKDDAYRGPGSDGSNPFAVN